MKERNNLSKLKIFMALRALRLEDSTANSIQVAARTKKAYKTTSSLLHHYMKFHYILAAIDHKNMDGCSYHYRLLKKGKRTLKRLLERFDAGLELDLMELKPEQINYSQEDKDWVKKELVKHPLPHRSNTISPYISFKTTSKTPAHVCTPVHTGVQAQEKIAAAPMLFNSLVLAYTAKETGAAEKCFLNQTQEEVFCVIGHKKMICSDPKCQLFRECHSQGIPAYTAKHTPEISEVK